MGQLLAQTSPPWQPGEAHALAQRPQNPEG